MCFQLPPLQCVAQECSTSLLAFRPHSFHGLATCFSRQFFPQFSRVQSSSTPVLPQPIASTNRAAIATTVLQVLLFVFGLVKWNTKS